MPSSEIEDIGLVEEGVEMLSLLLNKPNLRYLWNNTSIEIT